MHTVGHFINGKMSVEENQTQPIYDPSTGEVSKQVALGGTKTINARDTDSCITKGTQGFIFKTALIHVYNGITLFLKGVQFLFK